MADGFRPRPGLDVAAAIGELAVGEALLSFLDAQGAPIPVQRALVVRPAARVGALAEEERRALVQASPLRAAFATAEDRESAHERLRHRAEEGVVDAQDLLVVHACGLVFPHPRSGERIALHSAPPWE